MSGHAPLAAAYQAKPGLVAMVSSRSRAASDIPFQQMGSVPRLGNLGGEGSGRLGREGANVDSRAPMVLMLGEHCTRPLDDCIGDNSLALGGRMK
jgi:hypothetical protein